MKVLADNCAKVSLNTNPFGDQATQFPDSQCEYAPNFRTVSTFTAANAAWFQTAATNKLDFDVTDLGVAAGLDFLATLTYTITTDDCKDGGWQMFGVFSNQGDCVSYVASVGNNPPSGH